MSKSSAAEKRNYVFTKKVVDGAVSYVEKMNPLSPETIKYAHSQFQHEKDRGVIVSGEYDDRIWCLTDEVHKQVQLPFEMNEVQFERHSSKLLGCTSQDYQRAMRLYTISSLGCALRTIQTHLRAIIRFGESFEIPESRSNCSAVADFLFLLPCDDDIRDKMQAEIENKLIADETDDHSAARSIAYYQSAFRLDFYVDLFWEDASEKERILYFPVWFWWKVTTIIPLRATECILTPRNCLREDQKGNCYLRLRRTKQKANPKESNYKIEDDYEVTEYPIPRNIFKEIAWYIAKTDKSYDNVIDILFCKTVQFKLSGVLSPNDRHYTTANMYQLLQRFYNILRERYDLITDDNESKVLTNKKQIQPIALGDTRHIAVISTILTTRNLEIAKELARHRNTNVTLNYYSNSDKYVRAIHMDYHIGAPSSLRNQSFNLADDEILINRSDWVDVSGGKCINKKYAEGNFDDCITKVDEYGFFSCNSCRFFRSNSLKHDAFAAERSTESTAMLKLFAEEARKGKLNNEYEDLFQLISRIRTAAHASFEDLFYQDPLDMEV